MLNHYAENNTDPGLYDMLEEREFMYALSG